MFEHTFTNGRLALLDNVNFCDFDPFQQVTVPSTIRERFTRTIGKHFDTTPAMVVWLCSEGVKCMHMRNRQILLL